MTANEINRIRDKLKEKEPLIHAITNPISINQCANAVLALGARPMMAEHPREVGEITSTAGALLLNLGNITDVRMESMKISLSAAKRAKVPVVLDAVGTACSKLRRDFTFELLSISAPDVIKGNYSEIAALALDDYRSSGVDADETFTEQRAAEYAVKLAKKYGNTVLASGKTDIVTDGRKIALIKNGVPRLGKITGTGCMLGVICASLLSVSDGYGAALASSAVLGISGELADFAKGSGNFFVSLMDNLSQITDEQVEKNLKAEEYEI